MARRVSAEPGTGDPAVLDGKSSAKVRKARTSDISDEQIETFFATLVETCNVVRSAKAAGVSKSWIYRKRKSDAGFRRGWAEAVREGYARLELVLLERAMKGTPKLVRTARGTDRTMREYPNSVAIALLKRHADLAETAGFEHDAGELAELRERILERLERVRGQSAAVEGGPPPPFDACGAERSPSPSRGGLIETKAAVRSDEPTLDQRIALLALALAY